jgi:SulP family sulfate permease
VFGKIFRHELVTFPAKSPVATQSRIYLPVWELTMDNQEISKNGPPGFAGNLLNGLLTFMAAFTLAILITISAFSFSQLIFSGSLTAFSSLGFLSAMVSAVLIGFFVSLKSSLSGIVSIPQDRIAPIYALIVTQVMLQMPPGSDPSEAALLALAVICSTTLFTGLVLVILGKLRMGNLLRFIPYPVVGGFLAASGWLLFRGGIKLLTDGSPEEAMWHWFSGTAPFWNWFPGIVVAVTSVFLIRKFRHPLLTPIILLLSLVGFYASATFTGTSLDDLRLAGFLPVGLQAPWELDINWAVATHLPWHLLLDQSGLVATILVTTFVSIVLSSSAIELMTNQEADLNHELRLTGWSNLGAGFLGGMVGFHSLSLSRFSLDLGIPGRKVPVTAALMCVLLIPAAPLVLPYVPNLIPGALLLILGLLLLLEWIVDGWKKFSRADFCVVLLILLSVALIGYLEGVLVGTVAAVILFIIKYSQVSVVTTLADGRSVRSNVERPTWMLHSLEKEGERIMVLRLRGFIFFGTATELLSVIRDRIGAKNRPPIKTILIDFQRVTGFDSSAAVMLTRILGMARRKDFELALCGMSKRVTQELNAAGIGPDHEAISQFPDLDYALEWAEDKILDLIFQNEPISSLSLRAQLLNSWKEPEMVDRFLPYLERFEFTSGDVLIRQGDPANSMFFIESGHVTAQVEKDDGETLRLKRQGGGTVVGEIGLYLNVPRTASVIADTGGVAYPLTRQALDRITRENSDLASAFHRYIVSILATRNASINISFQQSGD